MPVTDMNEPVNPIEAIFFMRVIFKARPWKALDPEAKRLATVNQTDIRVLLRPWAGAGTQDDDSSGAASIFWRASWMTLDHPLHKVTPRVLLSVAPPPGPGLSRNILFFRPLPPPENAANRPKPANSRHGHGGDLGSLFDRPFERISDAAESAPSLRLRPLPAGTLASLGNRHAHRVVGRR